MASAKMQRYKLLFRRRWWLLLLAASIGVCYQIYNFKKKEDEWVAHGRLVAAGRINVAEGATYSEQMHDIFGTSMELIRSREVRTRASERVTALHPDLSPINVTLRVVRPSGAGIIDISARGREKEYTKVYLNALLD